MRTGQAWTLAAFGAALALGGCGRSEPAQTWTVTEVKTVAGFKTPESMLPSADGTLVYVSNVDTQDKGYWKADGKSYISTIKPDGAIATERLADSAADAPIHAAKGMALLGGRLYFADLTELKHCDAATGAGVTAIALPGAVKLNDVASDGTSVYVSDTGQGVIYKVEKDGSHTMLKGPPAINGVTAHKGKIYAVSIGAGHADLYDIDPTGAAEAKPFGLKDHFTGLDGIEVMEDGSFILSDLRGNKLFAVSADRKTVTMLAEVEAPADIGVDRKRGLLYVPQIFVDTVKIYRLEKK